jgi:hypothetical protein
VRASRRRQSFGAVRGTREELGTNEERTGSERHGCKRARAWVGVGCDGVKVAAKRERVAVLARASLCSVDRDGLTVRD